MVSFGIHKSSLSHCSARSFCLPHPSISLLLFAKNSLRNFNGFSGSFVARCFIASSKCGVTF